MPTLGADAKLFVDPKNADASLKSLMLRKNGKLLVLQTFFKIGVRPPQFTKTQLTTLGTAVARRM
jgi:hypothetical protein